METKNCYRVFESLKKLKISASRHPQTDGLSEIINRIVENHLRCYCNYHMYDWDELLPGAEFASNLFVTELLAMTLLKSNRVGIRNHSSILHQVLRYRMGQFLSLRVS